MSVDHRQIMALGANALVQGCKWMEGSVGGDGRRSFELVGPDGTRLFRLRASDDEFAAMGQLFSPTPTPAPTPTPPPPPPAKGVVVGMNCPWFCTGKDTAMSPAQVDELGPKVIRDPGHQQTRWDHAASKGIYMLPLFEGTDISALSWMTTHKAFSGVVELSNEPFWNGISPAAWVSAWGPVVDKIKATYPGVKLLAPIDDWPTSRAKGPGTGPWTQQLLAARPSLKSEVYGWAIHPYFDGDPNQAFQHLQNGIDALEAGGVSSPRMFCTEWGWSRFNTSEANQAAYATTFLKTVAQKPEVAAVFWYEQNDNGTPSANRENGFGLYKVPASGNWDDEWSKAQVWQVMRDAITVSPAGKLG